MAETLGSLCDKLTIVKLKEYHTENDLQLNSLGKQAIQLHNEIDAFINDVLNGNIPLEKITFASNKVFKKEGNEIVDIEGNIGVIFSQLAEVNCQLWHEVEKGYDIENVPIPEKGSIVKMLAVLNLQRNKCIDEIDNKIKYLLENK